MAMIDFPALVMIWRRDLIRLSRDRAQIAGSLARPILWLIILGLGMGSAFPGLGGVRYVEYLFPGIVAMNLLFASFLSAISIIWDREFGFLKEMLVAPISRVSIALRNSCRYSSPLWACTSSPAVRNSPASPRRSLSISSRFSAKTCSLVGEPGITT